MTQAYVSNTNILVLEGLHDEVTAAYINNATVTVTVKGPDGIAVTGTTWPKTMTYVTASNGNYRAIISDTVNLLADQKFIAEITADGGADRIGRWSLSFYPRLRT